MKRDSSGGANCLQGVHHMISFEHEWRIRHGKRNEERKEIGGVGSCEAGDGVDESIIGKELCA